MDCLVRYGVIPEVARCRATNEAALQRGDAVVLQTHRGLQFGTVVEPLRGKGTDGESSDEGPFAVLRVAAAEDEAQQRRLRSAADEEFSRWSERIAAWKIDVQLVDLEWTLDRAKLILYVLNERGPECTKLAIQAAAAGLGVVEVQPVSSEGLVSQPSGGGCGSCGCHN